MEASKNLTASTTLITSLVDELVAALVNAEIHGGKHPRVQASFHNLRSHLNELIGLTAEDAVSIGVAEDFVFSRDRCLIGASITASRLTKIVQRWGSGGLEIDAGVSTEELGTFLEALSLPRRRGDTYQAVNTLLEQRQCRQIRLLAPCPDEGDPGAAASDMCEMGASVRLYQAGVELLQNTKIAVCSGGRIQFDDIHGQAEQLMQGLQKRNGQMLSVSREDQYDAFTFGHSVRASVLAMNFAHALTNDSRLLVRIGAAALLHDVGKSVIPFEVLHSNMALTEEERAEIAIHPAYGAEILLDHDDADDMAVVTAFGHHRTVDSGGYPETVHQHQQSRVTRIMKICDVYETLTAARPHERPITPLRAYGIMMGMTNHFDPGLLRKFIEANGVFPNGQLLQMNTGEIARVERQGPTLLLPTVTVVSDPEGHRLNEVDRRVVSLAESNARDFHIARALEEDEFARERPLQQALELQQRQDESGRR